MTIVADSGSTKTDWCLIDNGIVIQRVTTAGINPCTMPDEAIREAMASCFSSDIRELITAICFYGSGVRADKEDVMAHLLAEQYPAATHIEARSDMYGAARALCGNEEGIACILGTGANSCLYDGHLIVANTPAMGYILGDEGSGAVLGRLFLNALYKGMLPESIKKEFEEDFKLSLSDIINKVYREPQANRFLASLSPFIRKNTSIQAIREIVVDNFRSFIRKNIAPYQRRDLRVNALGSIAFYYRNELQEAADIEGFQLGIVIKSPFDSPYFISV